MAEPSRWLWRSHAPWHGEAERPGMARPALAWKPRTLSWRSRAPCRGEAAHLVVAKPRTLSWRSRAPCRGEAAHLVVAKPRTLSWRSRAPYCGEAAHLIVIERDVIEHGLSEDAPSLIGAVRTRPASPATRGRGRSLAARPCCLAHVKGACHWRMSLAHVTGACHGVTWATGSATALAPRVSTMALRIDIAAEHRRGGRCRCEPSSPMLGERAATISHVKVDFRLPISLLAYID